MSLSNVTLTIIVSSAQSRRVEAALQRSLTDLYRDDEITFDQMVDSTVEIKEES